MQFVIFHGSFGMNSINWYPYLRSKLEQDGHKVVVPNMPHESWERLTNLGEGKAHAEEQTLDNWMKTFETEVYPQIDTAERLVFVGHSLGNLYILHIMEKYPTMRLDSSFFVAPFLRYLGTDWRIEEVNETFYKTNFDFADLNTRLGRTYGLYGDNDPYVPVDIALEFMQKVRASAIENRGAGHMNDESGFGDFPLLYELCRTRY